MNTLDNIALMPVKRWPWTLLFSSALILELTALYFQYVMKLEPCVMCIYQRTAVFGIMFAALPAMFNPNSVIMRLLSFVGWGVSSVWGALIAFEHVQMQNPDNVMLLFGCDVFPNFPAWLPLHEMLPAIFEPRGTCGDIVWQFATLSMPQWMLVIFSVYSMLFLSVFGIRLFKTKAL